MRERMFRAWARILNRRPYAIFSIIVLITLVCGFLASKMKMNTNWSDLMPEGDERVVEYDRVLKNFYNTANSIIVVQGQESRIKEYAEVIRPKLEELTDYVQRVRFKAEKDFIQNHGFMLTKTDDLEDAIDIYSDVNLLPLISSINDNFEKVYVGKSESISTKEKQDNTIRYLDQIKYFLTSMYESLEQGNSTKPDVNRLVDNFLLGDTYIISNDKSMLLIFVEPAFNMMEVEPLLASTTQIREVISKMRDNFDDVEVGLTGFIPLQKDEMDFTTRDMSNASIIALVLVLALFIISFRMFSTPILALVNLILSIIVTLGISTFFVSGLNMMTAMISVILIGLGIDFAIHIISIYNQERNKFSNSAKAMESALLTCGVGIITGAITTSMAFFTLMISETKGISEMGLILGIGIIVCMIVTLTFLPCIMVVRERILAKLGFKNVKPKYVEFSFLGRLGTLLDKHPKRVLIAGALITLALGFAASKSSFDYDYMNMEPKGIASVVLQDSIVDRFDLSTDFVMLSVSSVEESYEVAEKAKTLKTVGSVDGISNYLIPAKLQKKRQPLLYSYRQKLNSTKQKELVDIDELLMQLQRLEDNIYEVGQMAFIGGQDKIDQKSATLIDEGNIIQNLIEEVSSNKQNSKTRLNSFQDSYFEKMKQGLLAMSNPQKIELGDIPDEILNSYRSRDGSEYLITIVPNKVMWDQRFLEYFTEQMNKIDEKISGLPVLFITFMEYIARDGKVATLLTILVVFVVLLIDLKSIKLALITMIPLMIGGIWMIGMLNLLGLKFNFTNVVGIPMIIGIGIDDGVHIIHRFKREGFTNTPRVLISTGKAVMLTSITTMFGFGSMMIAKYRGLASLGVLLVLGVGACFITSVFLLPPLVKLFVKPKTDVEGVV